MSELSDLYQEVILDHNRQPRNFRKMGDASRHAEGFNPLCGDKCTVYVKIEGDTIREVSFEGSGCAISKASSSIMTTAIKGKTAAEAGRLFDTFHDLVTGKGAQVSKEDLGKLQVFSGISEFPARVKCASLAWHTLKAALAGDGATVSTEVAEGQGA